MKKIELRELSPALLLWHPGWGEVQNIIEEDRLTKQTTLCPPALLHLQLRNKKKVNKQNHKSGRGAVNTLKEKRFTHLLAIFLCLLLDCFLSLIDPFMMFWVVRFYRKSKLTTKNMSKMSTIHKSGYLCIVLDILDFGSDTCPVSQNSSFLLFVVSGTE